MSQAPFVHSSDPRAVSSKRLTQSKHIQNPYDELPNPPQNIMYDRRVIRGNTHSKHTLDANAYAHQERFRRDETERKRKLRHPERTGFPQRATTPPPVSGRKHMDIQTETYLEELTDKAPEENQETQTDPLMDQPSEPLFMPKKSGIDQETQIDNDDLFDFDLEVKPILEVLVGKTLESSMMELMEEEELANIRMHQEEFEQIRNVELAEVQRLQAEAKRKIQEKTRRLKEEQTRRQARMELEKKVAARAFAGAYLSNTKQDVFGRLQQMGEMPTPVRKEVDEIFVPWLIDSVATSIAPIALSRLLADDLIRSILALSAVQDSTSEKIVESSTPGETADSTSQNPQ